MRTPDMSSAALATWGNLPAQNRVLLLLREIGVSAEELRDTLLKEQDAVLADLVPEFVYATDGVLATVVGMVSQLLARSIWEATDGRGH